MNDRAFINLWLRLALMVLLAFGVEVAAAQSVEVVEETSEYRLVKHSGGETRIPANPERIVVTFPAFAEYLTALDTGVAGITTCGPYLELPFFAPSVEDAVRAGECSEPNLEAILALQPDLIIASVYDEENVRAQLSRIAPTILLEGDDDPEHYRHELQDIGRLLGREAEAAAYLSNFDIAVAEARSKLDKRVGDERVAFFVLGEREFRLYGTLSPINFIYSALGLTPAIGVPKVLDPENPSPFWKPISLELLPEVGAEHFFVSGDSETVKNTSLWQNHPAVQAGNVYPADSYYWVGGGILAREQVMRDVLEALGANE